jgi:formylglycine-generating enzyme required for sulfatase activity
MKKHCGILCLPAAILLALSACSRPASGGGNGGTKAPVIEMVQVNGAQAAITGDYAYGYAYYGAYGAFPDGHTVMLSPFRIAKYETTYQVWKAVYDWATSADRGANRYTIASPGREGHGTDGTGTAGTPAERATRPVTMINWRDAIVWCNAYSEMSGKEPVYHAAGTNDAGTASRQLGDYAWYYDNSYNLGDTDKDYGAHPVGTKQANSLGLYDMSGNVVEWCWDRNNDYPSGALADYTGPGFGVSRVFRGGGWGNGTAFCALAFRFSTYPGLAGADLGFRLVSP